MHSNSVAFFVNLKWASIPRVTLTHIFLNMKSIPSLKCKTWNPSSWTTLWSLEDPFKPRSYTITPSSFVWSSSKAINMELKMTQTQKYSESQKPLKCSKSLKTNDPHSKFKIPVETYSFKALESNLWGSHNQIACGLKLKKHTGPIMSCDGFNYWCYL